MSIFRNEKSKEKTELEKRIDWLESEVGTTPEEKKQEMGDYYGGLLMPYWIFGGYKKTLRNEAKSIRKDFEELDKKFDALERYLQIEYYKEDTETQQYDWADKKHSEGFRKAAKSYEAVKEEKDKNEKEERSSCDC